MKNELEYCESLVRQSILAVLNTLLLWSSYDLVCTVSKWSPVLSVILKLLYLHFNLKLPFSFWTGTHDSILSFLLDLTLESGFICVRMNVQERLSNRRECQDITLRPMYTTSLGVSLEILRLDVFGKELHSEVSEFCETLESTRYIPSILSIHSAMDSSSNLELPRSRIYHCYIHISSQQISNEIRI